MGWSDLNSNVREKIIKIADCHGLPYAGDGKPLIGLQLLFEPLNGATPQEIYDWATDLFSSSVLSLHQMLDPIFDIEKIAYHHIVSERRATIFYQGWKGGKIGFQLLPDPKNCTIEYYEKQVNQLLADLLFKDRKNPEAILIDHHDRDLSFFRSLPNRIKVYRGTSGISVDKAAAGICWTTRRDLAEWFAVRTEGYNKDSVLLEANVAKNAIYLAFANEFEVTVSPKSTNRLNFSPDARNNQIYPTDTTWDELY